MWFLCKIFKIRLLYNNTLFDGHEDDSSVEYDFDGNMTLKLANKKFCQIVKNKG